MKRTLLLSLLAAVFVYVSLSMAYAKPDFAAFRPYFTAAQGYKVYAQKSLDSRVVSRIESGDDVFIIDGGSAETHGGVQGTWFQVAHGPDGKTGAGYIFGDVFLNNDSLLCGETRFIYTRKLDDERGLAEITFRALDKNGRLLAETQSFTTISARPSMRHPLDGKGLDGVHFILGLYVSEEACGIPDCSYYCAWTGSELALLPSSINLGGAGMDVTYDETLIFPSGGAPDNSIVKTVRATEYFNESEDDDRIKGERDAKQVYLWDGKRVVPQPPMPELFNWYDEYMNRWYYNKK